MNNPQIDQKSIGEKGKKPTKKRKMRKSIAFSTYISKENTEKRIEIFKECIDSLYNTNYSDKVIIVDDCSVVDTHLNYASQYNAEIIKKEKRGGVARCKNTGIKKCLENNAEIFFLSDDDVVFINENWAKYYEEAYLATGIEHISYALGNSAQKNSKIVSINNYNIRHTPLVNGCFLMATKTLIDKIGYFKCMSEFYGHEHSNFSTRYQHFCGGKFYDIVNSNDLISHHNTTKIPSMSHEERIAGLQKNGKEFHKLEKYVEIQE